MSIRWRSIRWRMSIKWRWMSIWWRWMSIEINCYGSPKLSVTAPRREEGRTPALPPSACFRHTVAGPECLSSPRRAGVPPPPPRRAATPSSLDAVVLPSSPNLVSSPRRPSVGGTHVEMVTAESSQTTLYTHANKLVRIVPEKS